jgi:formylglycine-generating enzyme required for sulfatase activity
VEFMNAMTDLENEARPANESRTHCYKKDKKDEWSWERACTGYRLPTEAEWEYAARAGTDTVYSFGDEVKDTCVYANGADQATKPKHSSWTVNEACDDGFADLAPVGHFKANAWGLYDMHGNVWEWVWDWYGPYPEGPRANYAGPNIDERRVLRGGSFLDGPRWLRSSDRSGDWPKVTDGDGGFRCARGAHPSVDP